MRFTEFEKKKNVQPPSDDEGGYFVVKPIMTTETQVFVVCPVCGEIHAHRRISPNGEFCGYRAPCRRGKICGVYLIVE